MQLFVIRNRIRIILPYPTFRIISTKRNVNDYLKQLLSSETVHKSMVGGKKVVISPMF